MVPTGFMCIIFDVTKFIYSEKATKLCEIFTLLLTTVHTVKRKMKISQNFVAFSECMNFKRSKVNMHHVLVCCEVWKRANYSMVLNILD